MSTEKTRKLLKVINSQFQFYYEKGEILAEVQAGTRGDQTGGKNETVIVTINCPVLRKPESELCAMLDIIGNCPTVAIILIWPQHMDSATKHAHSLPLRK